jgi:hypothetical protein
VRPLDKWRITANRAKSTDRRIDAARQQAFGTQL